MRLIDLHGECITQEIHNIYSNNYLLHTSFQLVSFSSFFFAASKNVCSLLKVLSMVKL